MTNKLKCPDCDGEWNQDWEHGISIERHGSCVRCYFNSPGSPGTFDELKEVHKQQQQRLDAKGEMPAKTGIQGDKVGQAKQIERQKARRKKWVTPPDGILSPPG